MLKEQNHGKNLRKHSKKHNPRLQVSSVDEYIDIMNNLDLIPPMLIGSIPVLIIVGILSYFLSRKLVNDYQNRRKLKIEKKIKNK